MKNSEKDFDQQQLVRKQIDMFLEGMQSLLGTTKLLMEALNQPREEHGSLQQPLSLLGEYADSVKILQTQAKEEQNKRVFEQIRANKTAESRLNELGETEKADIEYMQELLDNSQRVQTGLQAVIATLQKQIDKVGEGR
eukprot:Nk52_evm5s1945 gene=Nk52_evmTU5s1945